MNKIILLLTILLIPGYSFTQIDSARLDSVPMFVDPEIPPSFPGGDIALESYIMSNLRLPTCSCEENLGTVYISFTIEKKGNLTGIKIIRGLGVAYNKESIRLIEQMPNWIPGSIHGEPVRVKFILPVHFNLL